MMTLTAAAISCLALNIYHEARDQPIKGQVAVAFVTFNRVLSNKYPDDVCDVVWQNKQFSWTHDGKSDKPKETKAYEDIVELVHKIANGEYQDTTNQSTHYHATMYLNKHDCGYIRPYWADSDKLNLEVVIGQHVFYSMN